MDNAKMEEIAAKFAIQVTKSCKHADHLNPLANGAACGNCIYTMILEMMEVYNEQQKKFHAEIVAAVKDAVIKLH